MTRRLPNNADPFGESLYVASLQGISHSYGNAAKRVEALKHVTVHLNRGQVTLIRGHSGSGKTTLLSILGLLLKPTRGEVYVCGEELSHYSEARLAKFRRTRVCFVFQGFNLLSALTAVENVQVGLALQGVRGYAAVTQALTLLDRVGLRDRADHRPAELSCGQQQRVAIARALASPAPLILADEPTASLDGASAAQVAELLRALAREDDRSVVVVTHDSRMQPYADREIVIENGLLSEKG